MAGIEGSHEMGMYVFWKSFLEAKEFFMAQARWAHEGLGEDREESSQAKGQREMHSTGCGQL